MSNRQTLAIAVVVVVAAVVLVLRSPLGGDPPPDAPSIAAGDECLGFAPTGVDLSDRALLERALASWATRVDADRDAIRLGATTPRPAPLGRVCAINAGPAAGPAADETYVTMVTSGRFATYVERSGTRRGLLATTGTLADPTTTSTLPALSVGAGRWQLSKDARAAAVHVGAPGLPEQVTRVPDGQAVVPVQDLVTTYAAAHPAALPHLLLILQSGPTLYAAVGGSPYAASTDLVLPVALTGGALGRTAYDSLLASPSGVPLLSQAIGFTPTGRQEPQRISRSLTLVGTATASVGPLLVVLQSPGPDAAQPGQPGQPLQAAQPAAVSVVQLSRTGADVQPIGTVPESGGWSGGIWLQAVAEGDHDPRTFVAVGAPARVRDPPVTLRVSSGGRSVTRTGPVAVLTGADLQGLGGGDHQPSVEVSATGVAGHVVPPLALGP
ncbi:MAG: hypothetical protein ABI243_12110 [Lapillicoccus sp.]